ncbi:MAG: hydrogenase nickel incorporation protein HypB [Syntrophomonadaceae bacterium]|nr:hydrogenase nickel incorporation protein HypB [Syntrophomonadaceae bacterium]
MKVRLEHNILGANELLARKNRNIFSTQDLLVINLMSSPGSGKTTILEKTIDSLNGKLKLGVIEGDLYTDQDAQRIEKKGVRVVQINTEGACHLDAGMVDKAFQELPGDNLDLLFIENVGNLVCPAEFDLGEDLKAVVISTTEGNDKVTKYPLIFREAGVIVLNKIDLLPYTDFSLERFREDLAQINPLAPVFLVSGRTGEGISEWNEWLLREVSAKRA